MTATATLHLASEFGPITRLVSLNQPRPATAKELQTISLAGMTSKDIKDRQAIASQISQAAENTGFFYISQHGVDQRIIDDAYEFSKQFFALPHEAKCRLDKAKMKHFHGYLKRGSTRSNPAEPTDIKEHLQWRYIPEFDPLHKDEPSVRDVMTESQRKCIRDDAEFWELLEKVLPGMKQATVKYWQACLTLARQLTRLFALALGLPEDGLDNLVTFPGGDGAINFYPTMAPLTASDEPPSIGLGSHTDFGSFTILYQDEVGGLEVINADAQWVQAAPVPGTFVVNIGDFLMRMTNDRWKSTVHRVVVNRSGKDRISMPFFMSWNNDVPCGVLNTCVDDGQDAKYPAVTFGEYFDRRMAQYVGSSI